MGREPVENVRQLSLDRSRFCRSSQHSDQARQVGTEFVLRRGGDEQQGGVFTSVPPSVLNRSPRLSYSPKPVYGQPVHDGHRLPVGHAQPVVEIGEKGLAALEESTDGS